LSRAVEIWNDFFQNSDEKGFFAMKAFFIITMMLPVILLWGCTMISHDFSGVQSAHSFEKTIRKHVGYAYLLHLPSDYSQIIKDYPLIMFLHDSGERGTDIDKIKLHGMPSFLDKKPEFPFIVVSPQCPDHEYYDNDALIALLDEVEAKYRVDKSRVYLTGLSMGGFGTWYLASVHLERFAAVAPVSGWGLSDIVENMKDVPVWAFHGANDKAVPISEEQEMMDELKKAGGDVRFTVYPNLTHNVWKQTYENDELYKWFLEHKKKM